MRLTLKLIPLLLFVLGALLLPGSAAWAGAIARGDLTLSQHRLASSIEAYRLAERLPGAATISLQRQGRALLARGQWREAAALYGGLADSGRGGSEVILGLAEALHRQGDVDAGLAALRRELELRPGDVAAWTLLVERAAEAGHRPEEIRALAGVVTPTGGGPAGDQRVAYLRGACLLNPESEEGRRALGLALAGPDPGMSEFALELLSAAETGDPGERSLAVARMLMAQGLVGPALSAAECATRGPAGRAEALALQGYGLTRLGQLDRAEELLRQAMELEPDLRLGEYALGSLLRLRGDEDGAADLLLRAARRQPPNPATWAELANSLAALGDFGGAERAMRLAAEAAPEDASVRLALVRFYVDSQYRPADILEDAREAVRLSGRSAEALSALGWALQLSGQSVEAREALLEAQGKAPRSALIRYRLGSIHQSLGDLEQAESEYRMVLELDAAGGLAGRAQAALSELEEKQR